MIPREGRGAASNLCGAGPVRAWRGARGRSQPLPLRRSKVLLTVRWNVLLQSAAVCRLVRGCGGSLRAAQTQDTGCEVQGRPGNDRRARKRRSSPGTSTRGSKKESEAPKKRVSLTQPLRAAPHATLNASPVALPHKPLLASHPCSFPTPSTSPP